MTFAEALNNVKAVAGEEEGMYFLNDGETGDELSKVGEYNVDHGRVGPRVDVADNGDCYVAAFKNDKRHVAKYVLAERKWVDTSEEPELVAVQFETSHIQEELETDEVQGESKKSDPVTFRLVITTQVYENYGAHNWDGEGECPTYWKAKGGNEYQREIGTANDVITLGTKGIEKLAQELSTIVSKSNDYYDEFVIGYEIVPSNEETYAERMYREMFEEGYFNESVYDDYLRKMKV